VYKKYTSMNRYKNKLKKALTGGLVFATGMFSIVVPASAADMTSASLLLGDSRPSQSTTYEHKFVPATTSSVKCVIATYSTSAVTFTGGANIPTGLTNTSATLTSILYNTSGGAFGTTGQTWTLNKLFANQTSITSSTGLSFGNTNQIQIIVAAMGNPSAPAASNGAYYAKYQSYSDELCTLGVDSVVVAFRIQNGVTVSATINPTLTFTVSGITAGDPVKGVNTDSGCVTTVNTAVSFPTTMVPDQDYSCGQQLQTLTNATNGATVTLRGTHSTGAFLKSTGNEIANTAGSNATPLGWSTVEAFGYTSSDAVLAGGSSRFSAADTWAAVSSTVSGAEEVSFIGVPGTETTNIAYRIRSATTTKAGAYSGTIVYVATPIF
jgi:hypothetical protein